MATSPLGSRMARLEGAYDQVSQRLMNIEPRFDALDRKIDLLRDTLDKKIDQRFTWTVGIIVTTWLMTIASIYLHH